MRPRTSMQPQMGVPYPNLLDIPMQANQQAQANWQQRQAQPAQTQAGMPSDFEQMLQQKYQQTGIPDALQNARFQVHNALQNTGIPGQMWGMGQDIQRGAQNIGALMSKFFSGM